MLMVVYGWCCPLCLTAAMWYKQALICVKLGFLCMHMCNVIKLTSLHG